MSPEGATATARAGGLVPDGRGRFGAYGGRYVPEVLIPALDELADAWATLRDDPGFRGELGGAEPRFRRAPHADHARGRGSPRSSATTSG